MLANDLNNAGWTVQGLLKHLSKHGEVYWTHDLVKELIVKRIMAAMLGLESTNDLEPEQVDKVYQCVSMNMAKIAGVSTPFPSNNE